MLEVAEPVGTALDHFDFVVQAFHFAAAEAVGEVVENVFPAVSQGTDELGEMCQPAGGGRCYPGLQARSRLIAVSFRLEDGPELFFERDAASATRQKRRTSRPICSAPWPINPPGFSPAANDSL